jgi:hypothetical protein
MARVGLAWHGLEDRPLTTSTPALLPIGRENGAVDGSRTRQILLTMEAPSHESSDGKKSGLPGRIRTCNVRFRRPAPVPLDGERTHQSTHSAFGWNRTNTSAVSAQRYHQVSFERENWQSDGAAEWSRTTLYPITRRVPSRESYDGARSRRVESNHPVPDYETGALPRELRRREEARGAPPNERWIVMDRRPPPPMENGQFWWTREVSNLQPPA